MISLKKHWEYWLGIPIGLVLGFWYYREVGCSSGACPLSSNPYITMTYFAFLTPFVFSWFKGK